jgi:hypothetical protein
VHHVGFTTLITKSCLCIAEAHVSVICVAGKNKPYSYLCVKCAIFLPDFNKFGVSRQIFIRPPASKFEEILPVGAALIRTTGRHRTEGHDEANRRFSRSCERPIFSVIAQISSLYTKSRSSLSFLRPILSQNTVTNSLHPQYSK